MKEIDLYITAVGGMLLQATEMLERSFTEPQIDQNRYMGEKFALERVLRYLNSQRKLEESHGVSLAESLALMRAGSLPGSYSQMSGAAQREELRKLGGGI